MNTDMDIDINTVTDTITCRLVEARADLGITQKELAIVKAAKAKADEIKGSAYMIKVLCFLFDTKYHMHYIISF